MVPDDTPLLLIIDDDAGVVCEDGLNEVGGGEGDGRPLLGVDGMAAHDLDVGTAFAHLLDWLY